MLSNEIYQSQRPDVVVGIITSQMPVPLGPTDCDCLIGGSQDSTRRLTSAYSS
ncbi:MAG: hypothetical protein ABL962_20860 [Fimbriimonadaceae bacterium]